ncbi:ArsC/Spx/MgsR family protein [Marinomonas sp. 5E14-1]|uniref:ArsC/Spx/MgsR family protein n=1 Tax=Marinomonas sp. 5E14-1 TaxID=3153922 RepID=UPI003263CA90
MRTIKSPTEELGLLSLEVSDEALLDAMIKHPILVNRPLVCPSKGVRLCRPSEAVLNLLDNWPATPFYKEDGEMIIDEQGKRVK